MQGFFILILIFGNDHGSITSQQGNLRDYTWDKCQAAGEFVRQQYPKDFRFVCVPNPNSVVDAPQGLPGRDRFFPAR